MVETASYVALNSCCRVCLSPLVAGNASIFLPRIQPRRVLRISAKLQQPSGEDSFSLSEAATKPYLTRSIFSVLPGRYLFKNGQDHA